MKINTLFTNRAPKYIFALLMVFCHVFAITSVVSAQDVSTQAALLIKQEAVEYSLPTSGNITPDSPLFFLKSIKNNIIVALTFDPVEKCKKNIELADMHASYALDFGKKNKTNMSLESLSDSLKYHEEAYESIEGSLRSEDVRSQPARDMRLVLLQSMAKSSQIARELITILPHGEADRVLAILDGKMTLKNKIEKQN